METISILLSLTGIILASSLMSAGLWIAFIAAYRALARGGMLKRPKASWINGPMLDTLAVTR